MADVADVADITDASNDESKSLAVIPRTAAAAAAAAGPAAGGAADVRMVLASAIDDEKRRISRKRKLSEIKSALIEFQGDIKYANEQANRAFECNTELSRVSLELQNLKNLENKLASDSQELKRQNNELQRQFDQARADLKNVVSKNEYNRKVNDLKNMQDQFELNKRQIEECKIARKELQGERQNVQNENKALIAEIDDIEADIDRINATIARIISEGKTQRVRKMARADAKITKASSGIDYKRSPYSQDVNFVINQAASKVNENELISSNDVRSIVRDFYDDPRAQDDLFIRASEKLRELGLINYSY